MLRVSEWKAAQKIRETVGGSSHPWAEQHSPPRKYFPDNKPERDEVSAPGLIEVIDPQTGQPLLCYPEEKPYLEPKRPLNNNYTSDRPF